MPTTVTTPHKRSLHVYLAGPDVFYPDAVERGARKKAYLAARGMVGHFPFDNEITKESQDMLGIGPVIAAANEQMMLDCCGPDKIGIILADMTPFHGPSMDVGTAFEVGFMSALSRLHDVILIGYTPDPRLFDVRVRDDYYHGHVEEREDGLYGSDGVRIESMDEQDNLMIPAAIKRGGGQICATFEEAADLALHLALKKDGI